MSTTSSREELRQKLRHKIGLNKLNRAGASGNVDAQEVQSMLGATGASNPKEQLALTKDLMSEMKGMKNKNKAKKQVRNMMKGMDSKELSHLTSVAPPRVKAELEHQQRVVKNQEDKDDDDDSSSKQKEAEADVPGPYSVNDATTYKTWSERQQQEKPLIDADVVPPSPQPKPKKKLFLPVSNNVNVPTLQDLATMPDDDDGKKKKKQNSSSSSSSSSSYRPKKPYETVTRHQFSQELKSFMSDKDPKCCKKWKSFHIFQTNSTLVTLGNILKGYRGQKTNQTSLKTCLTKLGVTIQDINHSNEWHLYIDSLKWASIIFQ